MTEKQATLPGNRNHAFLIGVILVTALIVIWAIAITAGVNQRGAALHQAEDEVFRMNQIIAEQTGSLLLEVRASLETLDAWLRDNPQADPRTDQRFVRLVDTIRKRARIPIDIRLVSEDDGLFYIPSKDTEKPLAVVSDREYVRAQKDPDTRGFFIAAPVLSRVTHIWGLPVSYPLTSRNGGMSVIFVNIALPVLNELYETIRPKPNGAITLARKDGTILDRVPFEAGVMGTSVAGSKPYQERQEGLQHTVSPVDRQEKIISFRSIDELPLAVIVSVTREEILAPWRSRMYVWGGVLAAVTALLLFLGFFLHKSLRVIVASEEKTAALNEELRKAKAMSQIIAEHGNDLLLVTTLPDLRYEYVSPSIERNRGWTPEEFLSLSIDQVLRPEMKKRITDKLEAMLGRLAAGDASGFYDKVEADLPHKDGHFIPYELMLTIICDEAGTPTRLLMLGRDLSERKANEEMIRTLAFFDRLTGLPNRRLLEDRLFQLLATAERAGSRLALLFIDLDNFKPVNDTLGHAVGDWLLGQVAARMQGCLRASDTVARIGGDEFVVVLPEIASAEMALEVAEKIRAALTAPYASEAGDSLRISASIGVVLYPDQARDMRDLLLLSDAAMYKAKKAGRNQIVLCAVAESHSSGI